MLKSNRVSCLRQNSILDAPYETVKPMPKPLTPVPLYLPETQQNQNQLLINDSSSSSQCDNNIIPSTPPTPSSPISASSLKSSSEGRGSKKGSSVSFNIGDQDTSSTDGELEKIHEEGNEGKLKGWAFVRANRDRILELGKVPQKSTGHAFAQLLVEAEECVTVEMDNSVHHRGKHQPFILHTYYHDASPMYSAIPFLPLPAAVACFILNIVLPGTGTILSGFLLLCTGQPRVENRHNKISRSIFTNCIVGVCQMGTVTFMLVGWFWSITWGGLMIIHAIEYKQAVRDSKRAVLASAAIEALSRNSLRRMSHVTRLVRDGSSGEAVAIKTEVQFQRRHTVAVPVKHSSSQQKYTATPPRHFNLKPPPQTADEAPATSKNSPPTSARRFSFCSRRPSVTLDNVTPTRIPRGFSFWTRPEESLAIPAQV